MAKGEQAAWEQAPSKWWLELTSLEQYLSLQKPQKAKGGCSADFRFKHGTQSKTLTAGKDFCIARATEGWSWGVFESRPENFTSQMARWQRLWGPEVQ